MMNNTRPSWDEYFLEIAQVVSKRSTCRRRHYGAVIVKDNIIVSTGYNGAARGLPNCDEGEACYREAHNIPSGERYESCLAGDTVIKLLNGTYRTIQDLAENGEAIWVYSIDTKTGKIVPAVAIHPRETGVRSDLVKITLDNGAKIVCTHDHRILLRDCTYQEAGQLEKGDSLMPMYYNYSQNDGYECVSNTIKARKEKWQDDWRGATYKTPTHHLVWECANEGNRIEGNCIHHINNNRTDNRPDNLKHITRGEHTTLHFKGKPSHFTAEDLRKSVEKQRELLANDPEFAKRKSEIGHINMTKNWDNPEFVKNMAQTQSLNGKMTAAAYNSNPEIIRKRKIGRILKGISWLSFASGKELTEANYEGLRLQYKVANKSGDKGCPPPKINTILSCFPSLKESLEEAKRYNHKVISVEPMDATIPVYDMTVPEYENFAIALGDNSCVFVHNCRSVHAEANAIINGDPVKMRGATIYIAGYNVDGSVADGQPCLMCRRMILNAQIDRLVWLEGDDGDVLLEIEGDNLRGWIKNEETD